MQLLAHVLLPDLFCQNHCQHAPCSTSAAPSPCPCPTHDPHSVPVDGVHAFPTQPTPHPLHPRLIIRPHHMITLTPTPPPHTHTPCHVPAAAPFLVPPPP
jgi:hypothetical protein